jgi:hypothetical protein
MILLLSTCGEYYEMEETIFVADANDKNLPAYTEWGYNSFGAIFERRYFFSTNDIVPCKITIQDGMMTFALSGRTGVRNPQSQNYYSSSTSNENTILLFTFPVAEPMNVYQDLLTLHQKKVDLTDVSCELKMLNNSNLEDITLLSGNLFFKRAQLVRINDKENRVILSGTFEFAFLRNQLPEIMSEGRFDVGIAHLFVFP